MRPHFSICFWQISTFCRVEQRQVEEVAVGQLSLWFSFSSSLSSLFPFPFPFPFPFLFSMDFLFLLPATLNFCPFVFGV
jgi:hypothetical protein